MYTINTCTRFSEATLEICEKSNFDRNQLKLDTQPKNMYMY